jgi:dipeptidyl aminopeptidase/acylaminoacyl peptidase
LFVVEPIELVGDDGAPLDFPACENPPEEVSSGWRIVIEPVRQAFAVNSATGERIQLSAPPRDRALYGGVISPNGETAALRLEDDVDFSALYLIPLENPANAQRVMLSGEPTGGLSWSPDGDALLVAARDRESGDRLLIRLDVAAGTETILYRDNNVIEVTSPTWSPDGNSVTFAAAAEITAGEFEPRIHLVNADASGGQQLNTVSTLGPILWRPE